METDAKPLHREGERNLFCPYYRQCLDLAAKSRWLFWSCAECVHRHEAEKLTDGLLTCPEACPVYAFPKGPAQIEGL